MYKFICRLQVSHAVANTIVITLWVLSWNQESLAVVGAAAFLTTLGAFFVLIQCDRWFGFGPAGEFALLLLSILLSGAVLQYWKLKWRR
jgi:hypothetical protein